ncbi:ArsR/SmtB family transcription factor [Actinoplanes subglobosus]|uniref:ArsR/SmtB family transcription factor n=1 Tax=Actinoplanes subglobosus TaxID=1547892 RepID=A0ABV8IHG0_9ACTN
MITIFIFEKPTGSLVVANAVRLRRNRAARQSLTDVFAAPARASASAQGETSVACLAELVGAAPTAVGQHLAKLRLAGLVRGRREGTFIHYSAADPHVRALLSEALFPAGAADQASAATDG